MDLSNIEVWGLSGKMGVGKNFVGEVLLRKWLPNKPTMVVAFADHLKVEVLRRNRELEYRDVFEGKKSVEVRKILQTEGQRGREVDPDCWVNALDSWVRLHASRGIERFIVTDVRHRNELEWVLKWPRHWMIRVVAPERNRLRLKEEGGEEKERASCHPSEVGLDEVKDGEFDLVLRNDVGDSDSGEVLSKWLKGVGQKSSFS